MTWREVLVRTAAHIKEHGLGKGAYGRKGQPCCTLGALRVVIWPSVMPAYAAANASPSEAALYETCRNEIMNGLIARGFTGSIPPWNDRVETTADEVIVLLEEVANG